MRNTDAFESQAEGESDVRAPVIGIGMPVFNGAASIRGALDSLLAQTFRDFRIVISDNASTDGTGDICREYAQRDPRITYFRQPENIGAEGNFKYVFHASGGEFFMWAAADDVRSPEFLAKNLNFLVGNPDYVGSTLRTRFQGGDFDAVVMGDGSLDHDDFERRLIAFLGTWHANGRFYSLFRRRELLPLMALRWDFLGYDWSLVTHLATRGKFNRIDDGWVELGRNGVSNTTDIFSRYRTDVATWLLPFRRFSADVWGLMRPAATRLRLWVGIRLVVLNLHAFLAQYKVLLRGKGQG